MQATTREMRSEPTQLLELRPNEVRLRVSPNCSTPETCNDCVSNFAAQAIPGTVHEVAAASEEDSTAYGAITSLGSPISGLSTHESASGIPYQMMDYPPQHQSPSTSMISPSTSEQSHQSPSNPAFPIANGSHFPYGQIGHSGVESSTYTIPITSIPFSSDFDSFFNLPSLAPFSTFAFSDARDGQTHEVAQLLANIESGEHPGQDINVVMSSDFSSSTQQNGTFSPGNHPNIETSCLTSSQESIPLKPEASAVLLSYFRTHVRLPASLIPIDSFGWYQMQRYLLRVASKHNVTMKALLALTQLFSVHEVASKAINSADWKLAFDLQMQSCKELQAEIAKVPSQTDVHDALLAAIFLLAWFEVLCDDPDTQRSMFPKETAESVITCGRSWSSNSRRLLHWLNSFDAKASHLGGRQLLSPRSLEIVFQHRFDTSSRAGDNEHSDTEENNSTGAPTRASTVDPGSASRPSRRKDANLLLSTRNTPPNINKIKMDIFNAIVQPALEFHLVSQSFSRRIGSHDRHHRQRNTVEDEYEVVTACRGFETELKRLWKQRPQIVDLTAAQLSEIVHPDIARQLEELFSVYAAGFWCHFLYIHRVAWWSLPHSEIAKKAVEETWRMLQRSMGQHSSDTSTGYSTPGREAVIHPGLMWPLFLFGCETPVTYQQEWSVTQIKALAESSDSQSNPESSGSDMRKESTKSRNGSQNAIRAAALLEELIKRQNKIQARVDGKYLSLELFGCHFTII